MKELWTKFSNFMGEFWWVILLAFAVLLLLFIIVVKAKNARIRKLKKQLKATRTELESTKLRLDTRPVTVDEDSIETVEIEAADALPEEQTVPEPEPQLALPYYEKPVQVTQTNGTVKFTVVYDRPKDSWVIKKDGNERVTRRVDTKEEAMQIARELCRKYNASLVVHKKDGKFQKH